MRTRQLNHSVYQTQYHIVWSTKYRHKFLKPYVKKELFEMFKQIVKKDPILYIHQVNTGEDHVHMQIEIPPKYSVAAVVKVLKQETSRELRQKFKFIDKMYLHSGVWSVGYFVSTIGLNEEQIKKYIKKQSDTDEGVDLSAEFA